MSFELPASLADSPVFKNHNSPFFHFGRAVEQWGKKAIVIEIIGVLFGYIIPLFVLIPWSIAGLVRTNRLRKNPKITAAQLLEADKAYRLYVSALVLAILSLVIGIVVGVTATMLTKNYHTASEVDTGARGSNASVIVTMSYLLLPTLGGLIGFILAIVAEAKYRKVSRLVPPEVTPATPTSMRQPLMA